MEKLFLPLYEPAPWFVAASTSNSRYNFSSLGGLFVVMTFLGPSSQLAAHALNKAFRQARQLFDDKNACWFGVMADDTYQQLADYQETMPGIRYFWDFDQAIAKVYRVVSNETYHSATYIIDPMMRVFSVIPVQGSIEQHAAFVLKKLRFLIEENKKQFKIAPILIVPDLFEKNYVVH